MKKAILLILSLALIISMAGCGKIAAATTAKVAGDNAAVTTVAGESSAASAGGELEFDPRDKIFGDAGFTMGYPTYLMQYIKFQTPTAYGPVEQITKDGKEVPLYLLVQDGYTGLDPSEYATLTYEDITDKLLEHVTGSLVTYIGDSLVGTEISRENVTVDGSDYLKIIGKSTDGYMQPNYIAYFGFYTNEKIKSVHAPVGIFMFIASDDEKDISQGDVILKACMATMEPF